MLARPYASRLAVGLVVWSVLGVPGLPRPAAAAPAGGARSGGTGTARVLFVTNRDSSSIAAFLAARDGRLTAARAPVPTGTGPRGIALSPDGRAAYVVNSAARTVSAYSVAPSGGLTPLAEPVAISGTLSPFGVAVAPDGRAVYVVTQGDTAIGNEGPGDLLTFAIRPDGALDQIAGMSTGVVHPRTISVTPDGRFLFVGHGDPNFFQPGVVTRYVLAADGTPSPVGEPLGVGTSNGALAMTPDGRHLYVPAEGSGEIYGFTIGADASLTPVPDSPLLQPDRPIGTAVAPDGRHLYTVSLDGDTLYVYTIARDGRLILDATYPTGHQPDALAVSPDGRSLYVANFGSDDLTVYRVGPDGALRAAPGSPVPTGGDGPAFGSVAPMPNQGPAAAFSAVPGAAGRPTAFDASASTDPDGQVARYDWDFGDGTVRRDAGPTPPHTYARTGAFRVTLTVTDDEGCATRLIYTGRSTLCAGSAAAAATRAVTVAG